MVPDPIHFTSVLLMNSNILLINSTPNHSFLHDFTVESIDDSNCVDSGNGLVIVRFTGLFSGYKMKVNMKNGKKEGDGVILRDNGTVFLKLKFVNDLVNGEVIKKSEFGKTVLRGEVRDGIEFGVFEELNESGEVIWKGFYQDGRRYSVVRERKGMKGFYEENSIGGLLLSVSQYDSNMRMKHGRCFEFKLGYIKNECIYEHGVKKRTIREFIGGGLMRVFDDKGKIVYEGVWFGDMENRSEERRVGKECRCRW